MFNDEDDDMRILDSLPVAFGFNQTQSEPLKPEDKESSLVKLFEEITVFGFSMTAIPAITNLTYFMNLAFNLRENSFQEQANQVDFLVATLLITTKRANQAAEVLRKIQH